MLLGRSFITIGMKLNAHAVVDNWALVLVLVAAVVSRPPWNDLPRSAPYPVVVVRLAEGVDIYVNDAFGSAHRAHASTEGIVAHVPVAAAGLLMAEGGAYLGKALHDPERPFIAILGGAKVSDKLAVIQALLPKVDKLLVGGGMCFTFLKAQGHEVGKSLLEAEMIDTCASLL